jgi:hypothetical protein
MNIWEASLHFLYLFTMVLFSSLSSVADSAGAPNSALARIQAMGVASTSQLEAFLAQVCMINPTSVVQIEEGFANPKVCRDHIEVKINDAYFFVLVQHSGNILHYSNSTERTESDDEEKMRAFRCSPEDIFRMSAPILGLLGQPLDRSQYKVQPGLNELGRIRDSRFGRWNIIRDYSYNNLPCRDRYFELTVFPGKTSVQVLYSYDFPMVAPEEEPQHPISKDEAVSAAKAWFNAPHFALPRIESDVMPKIQKVIALPNSCFGRVTEPPDCRDARAQYCWELPFSWEESDNTFNGFLWVSLKTGQVIGTAVQP